MDHRRQGEDPFKLPLFLRNRALRRFGRDFDDSNCHPRAALRAMDIHKAITHIFIHNREATLQDLGLRIFGQSKRPRKNAGI